jgi:hypothetical protein
MRRAETVPDRRTSVSAGRGQWWACQDLNLGPHPYQQSRAHRCADRRFPRSLPTVRGEVMRCSRMSFPQLAREVVRIPVATMLHKLGGDAKQHLTVPQVRGRPGGPVEGETPLELCLGLGWMTSGD